MRDQIKYWENLEFKHDRWIEYRAKDIKSIQEKHGCYVVYVHGDIVYVGQSNSVRFRMAQHLSSARLSDGSESPWGDIDALVVKVKYPSRYGKEAMLEKRLIRKLKPRLNSQLKLKRSYRR